jgi:L-ribulose-5-phosphate 4-epimerase
MTVMSLGDLREAVYRANLALVEAGLVSLSFGNASGIDRDRGLIVIKPSGVPYDRLTPADLVVVDLADERIVEGSLRPSSDTPTHALLYRHFPHIGGVVHTHSTYASAWAQAGLDIPPLGTTHADHFDGPVPVTQDLRQAQIDGPYERETGVAIAATLDELGLDPLRMPAVLVRSHGPFTWGRTAAEAVTHAVALELVAQMAHHTVILSPDVPSMDPRLLARHFSRKHGAGAYYGQPGTPAEGDQ